jgi:DNA-binding transcriptional LysR family regulator
VTVLGAMPLARSALVPVAVQSVNATHPSHMVEILDGPYEALLVALRSGRADVLVGALRDPLPADDVVQELLFEDPLAIVARRDHPLCSRSPVRLERLGEFDWIAPRRGSPLRAHFEALARMIPGGISRVPVECNAMDVGRALLLSGDRLMLSSAQQVQNEIRTGQLSLLAHPAGRVVRRIGLTYRRSWSPTAAQSAVVEALRRIARAQASAGRPMTRSRSKHG